MKICVPNIGTAEPVEVIEILVKPGERVAQEQAIVTLEGDKASMEIPAPEAGIVESVAVAVGDKVVEGATLIVLSEQPELVDSSCKHGDTKNSDIQAESVVGVKKEEEIVAVSEAVVAPVAERTFSESESTVAQVYASPSVRRIAWELGVPLEKVVGTGEKGRIQKLDIIQYFSGQESRNPGLSSQRASVDFSVFGPVTSEPLNKLRRASGNNLAQNWASIPHVTQFDEADITDLEAFRQAKKGVVSAQGGRLTLLVFVMKAVVSALQAFPRFNASFDSQRENLIYKQYFHLGIAVDTPEGLVVPVIRDVDKKSILALTEEIAQVSEKARSKKLSLKDLQGGCFTISSLGGIGGTAFTPIINAPELAILGLSKAQKKPMVMADGAIVSRLMLPLSVSYDHRAIDGAEAARFTVFLSECLTDIRNILL